MLQPIYYVSPYIPWPCHVANKLHPRYFGTYNIAFSLHFVPGHYAELGLFSIEIHQHDLNVEKRQLTLYLDKNKKKSDSIRIEKMQSTLQTELTNASPCKA